MTGAEERSCDAASVPWFRYRNRFQVEVSPKKRNPAVKDSDCVTDQPASLPWLWEKPTRRGFPSSLATRPYRASPELAAPRHAAASVRTTRATRASGTALR